MSLVELFRRRPRDPRAMPFFLHLIDWRQTQRIWDAGYRERLAAMTDDQIVELAGAPVCLRLLGRDKVKELLCAIVNRQLGPDCLHADFITIIKETK